MSTGNGKLKTYFYDGYMYVYSQSEDGFYGHICWVADYLKVCTADEADMQKQFEKVIDMMTKKGK